MEKKAIQTIQYYHMLQEGDNVIVGVSGGADSVALLHFLFNSTFALRITAVHVDHGIRSEEAQRDANFVKEFCAQLSIPLEIYNYDVLAMAKEQKRNIEETGRLLRYATFEEVRAKLGAGRVAVAHHQNDNAETILMAILRGSGLSGLTGIAPVRGDIIRPLIHCSREEIEDYCTLHRLGFVTDSTNSKTEYTRNKIRLNLLPAIEQGIQPKAVSALARLADICREDNEYLNIAAKEAFQDCLEEAAEKSICLNIPKLLGLHSALQKRVVRLAFEEVSNLHNISHKHVEDALALLDKPTGKGFVMPQNIKVERSYNHLRINACASEAHGFCYTLEINEPLFIPEMQKTVTASTRPGTGTHKLFCKARIAHKLQIRTRQPGDRIYIASMGGHKKIKDIFIDKKIPRHTRETIPLLADGSEIIWIIDESGITNDYYKASHSSSTASENISISIVSACTTTLSKVVSCNKTI